MDNYSTMHPSIHPATHTSIALYFSPMVWISLSISIICSLILFISLVSWVLVLSRSSLFTSRLRISNLHGKTESFDGVKLKVHIERNEAREREGSKSNLKPAKLNRSANGGCGQYTVTSPVGWMTGAKELQITMRDQFHLSVELINPRKKNSREYLQSHTNFIQILQVVT